MDRGVRWATVHRVIKTVGYNLVTKQQQNRAGLFTGKDVPSLVTWLVFWLELVLDRR